MAKKKRPEADALKDEHEAAEGISFVTHPDVPKGMAYLVPPEVGDAVLADGGTLHPETIPYAPDPTYASATATLPARGDETTRTILVRLIADANGHDSYLTLEGAGVGRHTGTVRIWPDDQTHVLDFDGDTYEQTLKDFIATHAIVVIDESTEIRAGEPG